MTLMKIYFQNQHVTDLAAGRPFTDLLAGRPVTDLLAGRPVTDLPAGRPPSAERDNGPLKVALSKLVNDKCDD